MKRWLVVSARARYNPAVATVAIQKSASNEETKLSVLFLLKETDANEN